jgi:hypothetical protein
MIDPKITQKFKKSVKSPIYSRISEIFETFFFVANTILFLFFLSPLIPSFFLECDTRLKVGYLENKNI